MDLSREQIRGILLLKFKLGDTAAKTTAEVCSAFGPSAVTIRTVESWFRKFRSENFDLRDAPRSGRPSALDNDRKERVSEENPSISSDTMIDGVVVKEEVLEEVPVVSTATNDSNSPTTPPVGSGRRKQNLRGIPPPGTLVRKISRPDSSMGRSYHSLACGPIVRSGVLKRPFSNLVKKMPPAPPSILPACSSTPSTTSALDSEKEQRKKAEKQPGVDDLGKGAAANSTAVLQSTMTAGEIRPCVSIKVHTLDAEAADWNTEAKTMAMTTTSDEVVVKEEILDEVPLMSMAASGQSPTTYSSASPYNTRCERMASTNTSCPNIGLRSVMLYNFQRGLSAQQCFTEFRSAFGYDAPSVGSVYRWYSRFRAGNFNLYDKRIANVEFGLGCQVSLQDPPRSPQTPQKI